MNRISVILGVFRVCHPGIEIGVQLDIEVEPLTGIHLHAVGAARHRVVGDQANQAFPCG